MCVVQPPPLRMEETEVYDTLQLYCSCVIVYNYSIIYLYIT